MCSNSLDDAPEVFSHPNESVICHLYLFHCVLLCVGVCAQFLMFPCVPGAWMSPGLYCQSPKCFLSLSFLPIYSLLIHFSYISTFTSWLLILYYSVPSCLFWSSFHIHLCVLSCCCTCAWAHAHMPLFILTALFSSCLTSSESCGCRRAGRRRIFFSVTEMLGITQSGFQRGPCFWKYPGHMGIWCLTRGGVLTLLSGCQIRLTSDSLELCTGQAWAGLHPSLWLTLYPLLCKPHIKAEQAIMAIWQQQQK